MCAMTYRTFNPSALAQARRDRRVSQARLAAATDCSRNTVIASEAGRSVPSANLAARWADFLGVELDDLFAPASSAHAADGRSASAPRGGSQQDDRRTLKAA